MCCSVEDSSEVVVGGDGKVMMMGLFEVMLRRENGGYVM